MESREEAKGEPRGDTEQVSGDLASAGENREREQDPSFSPVLSTIESEEESDDGEFDDEEYTDENYYEYFDSFGLDEEFMEYEGSNSLEEDDFIEDDDVDPDELSYEELVALGDVIGVEKRGLTESEIPTCLRESNFKSAERWEVERCVICQIEYEEGESVVALSCQHPYHVDCVKQWLRIKKVCPICNMEASSSPSNRTEKPCWLANNSF